MKYLVLIVLITGCGSDPATGDRGPAGETGQPGQSCTVTKTASGALIACPDGSSAEVLDAVCVHVKKQK